MSNVNIEECQWTKKEECNTNDLPMKVIRCKTHHHACDCREFKYQLMEKALSDIMRHQEISSPSGYKMSSTWNIAKLALMWLDGENK